MNLQEFYDYLDAHDWFYQYADDRRAFAQGEREALVIQSAIKLSPCYEKIYIAFRKYVYSGPAFNTPKIRKPKRPEL